MFTIVGNGQRGPNSKPGRSYIYPCERHESNYSLFNLC